MFSKFLKARSEVWRQVLLAVFSCALVFCIGDVSPLSAAGNDRFEKRFPVSASPTVIVTNDNGFITVRGVPRSEVHVVGIKRSPNVEIDSETMGNRLRFDTHLFDKNMRPQDRTVDYVFEVPEKTSLEIHNVGGRVKVDGVSGGVSIDALNSSIELNDINGSMILRSVSGNMSIARSAGRIEANSISGDLRFTDLTSQMVDGSTASGNISFEGNFYDNGRYTLSNYSGFIDIVTPADSSFELDARSVKGSVQSEIPMKSKPHTPFNPTVLRQSLLGIYNDGAASVHLSSFSGKIRIRKK
jgi:Putative adhesin